MHKTAHLTGYSSREHREAQERAKNQHQKRKGEKTMARKRMVTRTVTETKAEVQIVVIDKSEITTINHTLTGTYESDDKILNLVKKAVETPNLKVLQLISKTTEEKCYGMLETEFIKVAQELDPATRKALEIEEASEETAEEAHEDTLEEAPHSEAPAPAPKKRGGKK